MIDNTVRVRLKVIADEVRPVYGYTACLHSFITGGFADIFHCVDEAL